MQVGKIHSRQQHESRSLVGRQSVAAERHRASENAVFHVEPVALAVGAGVGLYSDESTEIVEEADVEISHAIGHGVEQLHRAEQIFPQLRVALALLNGAGEQLAHKHSHGTLHGVGIELMQGDYGLGVL